MSPFGGIGIMKQNYEYKKGVFSIIVTYIFWGCQPLYFVLDKEIDTGFLLACRIVLAGIFCFVILGVKGKLGELFAVFRDPHTRRIEFLATVFLFADWSLYFIAIRVGRVMECAMGYYVMPLVMVFIGAVVYHEKLTGWHFVSFAVILVGICLSTRGFGSFPVMAVLLALSFPIYTAIKKSLRSDYLVNTSAEIIIMAVFAIPYILVFQCGESGLTEFTLSRALFLLGSGLITAVPMVFYAKGLSCLPMVLIGIIDYLGPTLEIVCGKIMGEQLTREKLVSFIFIWIGVAVFIAYELSSHRVAKIGKAEQE